MAENLYTHADSNVRKTWAYLTAIFVLLIGLGWVLSRVYDEAFFLYGFAIFAVVGNITSYWFSDKIALAMAGARAVSREENVRLYRIMENLCITAGLPLPKLYVIPGMQINAFATGRNKEHAAVAVTQGALELLDDNELTGVLAHELSHVGNRDILLSTVVIVMVGLITTVSDWFLRGAANSDDRDRKGGSGLLIIAVVAAILTPIAATLIHLAISRKREYLADASGALLTRYPEGLASALEKIRLDFQPLPGARSSSAHLFISNPFRGRGRGGARWLARLFQTHPRLEDRIRILRGME